MNIKTNSLARAEVLELVDKNKVEIIFLDIDNTVIKTNGQCYAAAAEIGKTYGKQLCVELKKMYDWTHKCIDLNRKDELKKVFKGKFVKRYWSRELWIVECCKKLKIKINPEELIRAADIYWGKMAKAPYWDDALVVLNKIKKEQIPIVWVTGGDANLKISGTQKKLKLFYDPDYAYRKKLKRLQQILNDFPGEIHIGTVIDKPEVWAILFEKYKINDFKKVIAIGDVYATDLENIAQKGGATVLIKRD